jgi:hypothetical protein
VCGVARLRNGKGNRRPVLELTNPIQCTHNCSQQPLEFLFDAPVAILNGHKGLMPIKMVQAMKEGVRR